MSQSLIPLIILIEKYCSEKRIDHRFVGGVSFGGLLNEKTTYQISITKKTIILKNHNQLNLYRPDDSIRDIDLIVFCPDADKFSAFKKFAANLQKEPSSPHISIENAIYHNRGKTNKLFQFVSTLQVDQNNQLYYTFESVKTPVSWQSVQPWKVILQDKSSYTVRNPIADYYAYFLRSPSGLKLKDRKKIKFLEKLADAVKSEGLKQKPPINYEVAYKPWQEFIEKLQTSPDPRLQLKRILLKLYWHTVGTTLDHGPGLLHPMSKLANKFTGAKQ